MYFAQCKSLKGMKGEEEREGRGNKVTYTFHVPRLLGSVLLYRSTVEGFSLESFRKIDVKPLPK